MGKISGLPAYIRERVAKTSAVIVVFSNNSFSSYWIRQEFIMAMSSADLVLVLNRSSFESNAIIQCLNSFLNVATITAPTYVKDINYINDEKDENKFKVHSMNLINQLSNIVRSRIQIKKFLFDILSVTINFTILTTAYFICYFLKLKISTIALLVFVLICGVGTAIILPSRARYSTQSLKQFGFKRVYRGWIIDKYRFQETIATTICILIYAIAINKGLHFVYLLILFWFIRPINFVLLLGVIKNIALDVALTKLYKSQSI